MLIFMKILKMFFKVKYCEVNKQEGHDGPELVHLYIGPRSGASLNPRAFI
jgi:hypothetical protein